MRSPSILFTVAALACASAACDTRFEGAGELRAAKATLQREVEGLRETVTRLERHETLLPLEDVVIAVDGALIRDIIDAHLPFDADIDTYHLRLSRAEVTFQDSPILRLGGSLYLRDNPSLSADVTAVGGLQDVVIDQASSTLRASVVVDHLAIEKLAGLESVLSGALLDALALTVRIQIADQLPTIEIPVKVQQTVELPRMVAGPIRLDAASLPLQVSVSRVVAGRGRLWIAVQIKPGDFAKEVRR